MFKKVSILLVVLCISVSSQLTKTYHKLYLPLDTAIFSKVDADYAIFDSVYVNQKFWADSVAANKAKIIRLEAKKIRTDTLDFKGTGASIAFEHGYDEVIHGYPFDKLTLNWNGTPILGYGGFYNTLYMKSVGINKTYNESWNTSNGIKISRFDVGGNAKIDSALTVDSLKSRIIESNGLNVLKRYIIDGWHDADTVSTISYKIGQHKVEFGLFHYASAGDLIFGLYDSTMGNYPFFFDMLTCKNVFQNDALANIFEINLLKTNLINPQHSGDIRLNGKMHSYNATIDSTLTVDSIHVRAMSLSSSPTIDSVAKSHYSAIADSSLKSWHSIIADSSIKSYHAIVSDSSIRTYHSVVADSSIKSYHATVADSALKAWHSIIADSSLKSNHSIRSDSAIFADHAETSNSSLSSNYATESGRAYTADGAIYSTTSDDANKLDGQHGSYYSPVISGDSVNSHQHARLESKSHPGVYWFFGTWKLINGILRWRLETNHSDNVSVHHSDSSGYAARAGLVYGSEVSGAVNNSLNALHADSADRCPGSGVIGIVNRSDTSNYLKGKRSYGGWTNVTILGSPSTQGVNVNASATNAFKLTTTTGSDECIINFNNAFVTQEITVYNSGPLGANIGTGINSPSSRVLIPGGILHLLCYDVVDGVCKWAMSVYDWSE